MLQCRWAIDPILLQVQRPSAMTASNTTGHAPKEARDLLARFWIVAPPRLHSQIGQLGLDLGGDGFVARLRHLLREAGGPPLFNSLSDLRKSSRLWSRRRPLTTVPLAARWRQRTAMGQSKPDLSSTTTTTPNPCHRRATTRESATNARFNSNGCDDSGRAHSLK